MNGIVGLKPTYGRVSRFGVILASSSLDHVGPMARTVEDCALMLEVIAGGDPLDPASGDWDVPPYSHGINDGIEGMRLGVDRDYFFSDQVDSQVRKAVSDAIVVLESLGAKLVNVRIPDLDLSRSICLTIMLVEAASIHSHLLGTPARSDYDPMTQLALETGMLIPGTLYLAARHARRIVRDRVKGIFRRHQLRALIGPTLPVASIPLSDLSVDLAADSEDTTSFAGIAHHLNPANVTGQPSMTLPCGFTTSGSPIGLQLIGRPLDEACIFRIGHAYEQATSWNTRQPTFVTSPTEWASRGRPPAGAAGQISGG
jgi:aspartyl-tRNA(Asn)/glutamyl-tRNA(Gln) amidotransferase subunit A